MIIILDMFFIIGMLIFGIGFIKLVADNILLIILAIALIIGLLFLFVRWPKQTFVILLILLAVTLIATYSMKANERNNITVRIYKAIGECQVYDIDHNPVTIPAGAMIARYTDESERQSEIVGGRSYAGFTYVCCWYYQGKEYTFHESWAMNMENASCWDTQKVKEITYKEFENSNWWLE